MAEDPGALPLDSIHIGGKSSSDPLAGPRYVPTVCGVQSWATTIAGTPAMNVSVAPRSDGVTVLATPREGGSLTGFSLDTQMDMLDQNKIAIDGTFTEVVASSFNGRLLSSAIQGGSVFVHLLDTNLTNPQLTAKIPGAVIAEPAFSFTQQDIIMPVAAGDGLWLYTFNASFEATANRLVVPSDPVRSMTAAQLDGATMIGWSTDSACYMMRATSSGGGIDTRLPVACANPRMAANPVSGDGVMVFDSPEGVRLATFSATSFGGGSAIVRSDSGAPRVAFDGSRFWVSYLDARGDLIVGILDGEGNVTSMSLAGPRPEAGAYEMTVVGGIPWVFMLGADGYSAYHMCAVTQ